MMATQNQQRAAEIVLKQVADNQPVSVSRAMESAGYAPTVAKNPQKLTTSEGWHELMDRYFPADLLARIQLEGLYATRYVKGYGETPDYAVRLRYLELALRIKGYLSERNQSFESQPFNARSLAELLSAPEQRIDAE